MKQSGSRMIPAPGSLQRGSVSSLSDQLYRSCSSSISNSGGHSSGRGAAAAEDPRCRAGGDGQENPQDHRRLSHPILPVASERPSLSQPVRHNRSLSPPLDATRRAQSECGNRKTFATDRKSFATDYGARCQKNVSWGMKAARSSSDDSEETGEEQEQPIGDRILTVIDQVLLSQRRLEAQLERMARDSDGFGSAAPPPPRLQHAVSSHSISPVPSRSVRLLPSWPTSVSMRPDVDTLLPKGGSSDDICRGISFIQLSSGSIRRRSFDMANFASLGGIGQRRPTPKGDQTWTEWRSSLRRQFMNTWQPDGLACITFELLGFLVLLHDLCITPWLVAWDVAIVGRLLVLNIASTSYWACALLLEFQVGFFDHGELIMDRRVIALRYLRGWFPYDLALLASDLVVASLQIGRKSYSESTERLVRMSKVCRLFKVFRLVRFFRLLNKMTSSCMSTHGRLSVQAAKIVFSVLIYNHFVCCAWYMTGKIGKDKSWLQQVDFNEDVVKSTDDMVYEYLTCFHWTLAQMTPGPISIGASNTHERAFNCCLLICGLLFGSSIVSVVTGHIMQLIILRRDKTQKLDILVRFLRQNAIRQHLAVCVHRQVMQRLDKAKFLEESQVPALELLSVQLRQELTVASRSPHLRVHPLFRTLDELNAEVLPAVSLQAARCLYVPAQDELFFAGMQLSAAYFLISGEASYMQEPETSFVRETVRTDAPLRTLICEAALWSEWHAVGRLEIKTESHFIALEADDLYVIVRQFPPVAMITQHYGRAFHLRIASAIPPHAPWPTDLVIPFTEGSELLSPQVGVRTLRVAKLSGNLEIQEEALQELEEEVRKEKCAIQQVDGAVTRVVAVVALHVNRADSRFLAQLGHWEKNKGPKVSLTLPGTKRRIGELPQTAFERVLEEDLSPLKSGLTLENIEHQVERKHSEKYTMVTLYNRAIHFCILSEPIEELDLPAWMPPLEDVPPPIEMHAITAKGRAVLYGWLTDDEFSYYGTEEGSDTVRAWLDILGHSSFVDMDEPGTNGPHMRPTQMLASKFLAAHV